ncbi:Uncharacterised protein [Mycobacterium tuberculosis]|nr:Uncharacterised protein [Mycobacterium tuberculosis]
MAPLATAVGSWDATRSAAMIRTAPDSRAAWIAAKPTPPQPITSTVSPARTPAVRITAPTPVVTPQPSSAA